MPRQEDRKDFIAEIVLESASGRREARVSDISAGGCYIDTIVGVRDGETVNFDLIYPNGGRLAFTGEVAYHFEGVGFGVKFINLTDEQKLFLERILK